MYYEDLGLYFHDKTFFDTENPVVRDDPWRQHVTFGDDTFSNCSIRFICVEFSVSKLASDEIADLEWEIRNSFPDGEYISYFDASGNDTGDREIGGSANSDTYRDVIDILESYGLNFDDFTTYE